MYSLYMHVRVHTSTDTCTLCLSNISSTRLCECDTVESVYMSGGCITFDLYPPVVPVEDTFGDLGRQRAAQ